MDSDILLARIDDAADIAFKASKCKYLGFLSPEQAVAAEKRLKNRGIRFDFYGGYDGAQRVMLGCFPDWADGDECPITAVTFKYRKSDELSHRDFLGSLMGLGLTRESVGDILISEGKAVVFLCDDIADFVLSQITKIGRTGVTATVGVEGELPECGRLAEFTDTVASARLDCIVAALGNMSRGAAVQKIEAGLVTVNSFTTEKITLNLCEGDILAIRGKGKFIICSLEDRTRKNRVVLKFKKYV